MKRPKCVIVCKECNKEHLVTDIDFVNDSITYIIDDLRCTLETKTFKDIDGIRFKE